MYDLKLYSRSYYGNYVHLQLSFNQPWLARDQLEYFTHKIHEKVARLDYCMDFIDETEKLSVGHLLGNKFYAVVIKLIQLSFSQWIYLMA